MDFEQKYKQKYRNVDGIMSIIKDGLCHRCGACVGVCPEGTFQIDRNGFPEKIAECIDCNICVQTCSGIGVDYDTIGSRFFQNGYRYGSLMGPVLKAYVGHANDQEIRKGGASGGVITQLFAYLLESKKIKGAIVVIEDPDDPSLGKGIIARKREELLLSQQSRYTTSPSLSVLKEIQEDEGPYALVGLPCQIHALRKIQQMDPRWKSRIPIVIGLLCHYNLPNTTTREIGKIFTPKEKSIKHIKYRESETKGWPNNTLTLTFNDDSSWSSPLSTSQIFNALSRLSKLGRCVQCLDATAEFSDLSVSDPWIRDKHGDFKFHAEEGYSAILVRTSTGMELIKDVVHAEKMELNEISAKEVEFGQLHMMREKKLCTAFRLKARKKIGLPTPVYPIHFLRSSPKTILQEITFWIMRTIPHFSMVRHFLIRLTFSQHVEQIFHWHVKQKKKRFAKNHHQTIE